MHKPAVSREESYRTSNDGRPLTLLLRLAVWPTESLLEVWWDRAVDWAYARMGKARPPKIR